MKLFKNGREVGEVEHYKEHEVRLDDEPHRICEFEVDGDIGDGPLWLEDDGGEWQVDVTYAWSGTSSCGRHWRVEAEISTRH